MKKIFQSDIDKARAEYTGKTIELPEAPRRYKLFTVRPRVPIYDMGGWTFSGRIYKEPNRANFPLKNEL